MKAKFLIGVLLSAMFLQACSFSVEDGDVRRYPTIGQELIDLEKAYEEGVISGDEFDRIKERILNKRR